MVDFSKYINLFKRIFTSRASAQEVASGFAIGLFVAMTPTLGFQTVIALAFASIMKKNELAALLGVWLTNPLTAFPLYYLSYYVGQHLLLRTEKISASITSFSDVFELSMDILVPLWLGGVFLGAIFGLIGYYAALGLHPFLKKRAQHLQEKIGKKIKNNKKYSD